MNSSVFNPHLLDSPKTFDELVNWFYSDIILRKLAPGFLVGLSGTDSLVAFMAAYKALEKANAAHRMLGVHFAPSEDFIDDHPEAGVHLWFRDEVMPWLKAQAPKAQVVVDDSIDWRCDGQRWGALMDMSVVSNDRKRWMRLPEDQYWVVGTRNRTEDTLLNYSNASKAASLQPLIHLWKSDVLQLSEYLNVPKIAIAKSCETDCICGRMRLPAEHIHEMDLILMARQSQVPNEYIEKKIHADLRHQLNKYIDAQIAKARFKDNIPYIPPTNIVNVMDDILLGFESGYLNLKEFNHRKHLYVAWAYLNALPFESALERYLKYLKSLLVRNGQEHRYNENITRRYFEQLDISMRLHPADNFDHLVAQDPHVLDKISA